MRPVVQAECTLKESAAINQILGRRVSQNKFFFKHQYNRITKKTYLYFDGANIFQWHGLSREEQAKYYEKARMERQRHMQLYPHWNARDNYRYGAKKKKRKRDKSDDPGCCAASQHLHQFLREDKKKSKTYVKF